MQCAAHPSVETELACSRCEKPICPRCLVNTPVGARCRECAGIRRIPTYNLSPALLARGVAAAVTAGAIVGVAWWIFAVLDVFFYGVLAGLAIGFAVGEAVAIATNRRAGPPLQVIAVVGVLVAVAVRATLLVSVNDVEVQALRFYLPGLVASVLGCYIAAQRVR